MSKTALIRIDRSTALTVLVSPAVMTGRTTFTYSPASHITATSLTILIVLIVLSVLSSLPLFMATASHTTHTTLALPAVLRVSLTLPLIVAMTMTTASKTLTRTLTALVTTMNIAIAVCTTAFFFVFEEIFIKVTTTVLVYRNTSLAILVSLAIIADRTLLSFHVLFIIRDIFPNTHV